MPYKCFDLLELPRLLKRPFRLRHMAWMPDHLHYNSNRTITLPHFCWTLRREPRVTRALVNGILQEHDGPLPYLSIIPVGTRLHTLNACRRDELMFTLIPEDYELVMNMVNPVEGVFRMNVHIEQLIKEIFEDMEYIYVPGAADRMDGLFLRLLEETTLAVIRMKTESAEDPVIYEVISFLNAHFMDRITLEDVCRKYSLSRRTLYRRWSECFDHTPAEFLLRKRLDYADQLLLTSDLSIQTVAERSGFRNPIYFTQCYRRAFGLSPTRRRKEENKE